MTIYKDQRTGIAIINYINQEGKRRKKSTGLQYTKENIKIIEKNVFPKLREKLLEENIDEKMSIVKQYTVKEICLLFLEEKEQTSIRKYTIIDYKKILMNYFVPHFEGIRVNDITSDDLQKFFLNQKEKKSVKTLRNYRNPINQIFQKAIRMELMNFNPLKSVEVSIFRDKTQHQTKHMSLLEKKEFIETKNVIDPFYEEEVLKIIETAKGTFKNFLALLYFTALRPSELLFLEWKNVSLEEKFLFVEGAITGKQTEYEEDLTKTISSRRIVYLSDLAIHFLKQQFKQTGEFDSGVFLTQYKSKYMNGKSLNQDWRNLFDHPRADKKNHVNNNLGIRYRDMYNLRHSFASNNLSTNRLPLLFVSKQMGHINPETTLKKYSMYIVKDDFITIDMLNKSVSHITIR
jgi:integrase